MTDADGDGYGDMNPSSNTDIAEGSDCDDEDDTLHPGIDTDGDLVNYCLDCDDLDSENTEKRFEVFDDLDGDGYGATSYWTCGFDSDGDGDVDDDDTWVLEGGDCWDSVDEADISMYAYPGVAFNESELIPMESCVCWM